MNRASIVLTVGLCLTQSACVGQKAVEALRAAEALKVAGIVEKDIRAANEKVKSVGEALTAAQDRLARKEFPADLPAALATLTIPFDTTNLDHRGLTDLPAPIVRRLLDYTMGVQALNGSIEQLKNIVTMVQPQVEKAWKEEKQPTANFSVIFRPEGGKGMVAELVPNKDPFQFGADFPKEYTVVVPVLQQGSLRSVEKRAKRWESGGLTGSDPIAIPVSPFTTAFVADKVIPQLRLKMVENLEAVLGKNKETPMETVGLLRKGDDVANELHKLAVAE